jgi:hypothetical protein
MNRITTPKVIPKTPKRPFLKSKTNVLYIVKSVPVPETIKIEVVRVIYKI